MSLQNHGDKELNFNVIPSSNNFSFFLTEIE